jgi:hypothetical protein
MICNYQEANGNDYLCPAYALGCCSSTSDIMGLLQKLSSHPIGLRAQKQM